MVKYKHNLKSYLKDTKSELAPFVLADTYTLRPKR